MNSVKDEFSFDLSKVNIKKLIKIYMVISTLLIIGLIILNIFMFRYMQTINNGVQSNSNSISNICWAVNAC